MKVGLISKIEHCGPHKAAIEELGHTVKVLGGNPRSIPASVDAVVIRIRSCSHPASDVAQAWKRANPNKPFVMKDGKTGIIRALTAAVPAPVKEKSVKPVEIKPVAKCPPVLLRQSSKPADKVYNLLLAVRAGNRRKSDILAWWHEHGLFKGVGMYYLNDALKYAKKEGSVLNRRKRGQGLGWYVTAEEWAAGVEPPPSSGTVEYLDDQWKASQRKASKKERATSSNTRARVREAKPPSPADLPTDSIRDEVQLLVLWLREWNVKSLSIDAEGGALLSNTPQKTRKFDVSFTVKE